MSRGSVVVQMNRYPANWLYLLRSPPHAEASTLAPTPAGSTSTR